MKKRLFALVLLLLLLAGCTAAPEADYMAPVRAYCLALQNNDFPSCSRPCRPQF